jgi:hypothetical protein
MQGFDGEIDTLLKKVQEIKEGMPEVTGRRSIDTSILL